MHVGSKESLLVLSDSSHQAPSRPPPAERVGSGASAPAASYSSLSLCSFFRVSFMVFFPCGFRCPGSAAVAVAVAVVVFIGFVVVVQIATQVSDNKIKSFHHPLACPYCGSDPPSSTSAPLDPSSDSHPLQIASAYTFILQPSIRSIQTPWQLFNRCWPDIFAIPWDSSPSFIVNIRRRHQNYSSVV